MRKIKIKVKYLLLTAFIIISASAYIVPKAIYARAKELESTDMEASKVLYQRFISMVPFSNKKANAMFKIANEIAPHEDVLSMYEIRQFGSGFSGKMLTPEIVMNALEYYDKIYRNYPDNQVYIKSYKRLLDIHIVLGEHDKSKELIENGLNSTNAEINFIAQKYSMFYSMLEKKYDEAKSIGEILIEQRDKHNISDVYIMLGYIYSSNMNFEKAIDYYEKYDKAKITVINNSSDKTNDYKELTVYNLDTFSLDIKQQMNLLNNMKSIYNGKSEIHGKVMLNDKPLAFASIYLRDSRFIALNAFRTGEKGYPIWTDAEGNYRVPNLPKGQYDLEIDIPLILLASNRTVYQNRNEINKGVAISENESKEINFNFVEPLNIEPRGISEPKDNKININWEKVEGAAYYYLNITTMDDPINLVGSSSTGSVSEKITDTNYILHIDEINKKSMGLSTDGDGLVSIQSYLGTFFSEFKVPFSVTAYDKNDNIISSSSAIQEKYENLNIITIPKVDILEGDELLMHKKPEEALKSYEKHLANNPNDIHTIEVLTRMYKIGIRNDWEKNKFEGRDLYKAMELANRSYRLTGSIEEVKYVLSYIYTDFNNAKDYQWALEQILKLPTEHIQKEQYADLGNLYLRLKNFNKAEECFSKARSMGHDFLYDYPLLELYLENFDNALELTKNIEYFMYNGNKENFMEGLKEIKDIDKVSEDYKVFRDILGKILSKDKDYKKEYNDKNTKIKDKVINKIMLEIAREHNLNEAN
jgi:tetratricopeptide (TPR) repeat protein